MFKKWNFNKNFLEIIQIYVFHYNFIKISQFLKLYYFNIYIYLSMWSWQLGKSIGHRLTFWMSIARSQIVLFFYKLTAILIKNLNEHRKVEDYRSFLDGKHISENVNAEKNKACENFPCIIAFLNWRTHDPN